MEKEQETIYASFINRTPKRISKDDFIDLVEFIEDSYKKNQIRIRKLENLDLSDIDFSDGTIMILNPGTITMEHIPNKVPKNFDNWVIENVIFSRFNPECREKKHLYGLSFKGTKMRRVGFAQAFLDRCNFDSSVNDDQQKYEDSSNGSNNGNKQKTTVLNKIDFFFSEFSYCRFVRCKMNKVDFRYSKVSDCSMRELRVIYGDFYFCTFSGCSSFQASKFIECSFTNAVFENNVIRFRHIKGLLQDNPDKYFENVMAASKSKLKWFRYNPTGTFSNIKSSLKEESKEMFRLLSGIYASKGLNKDSNAAYREMKIRELRLFCENVKDKGLRTFWKKAKESVLGLLLILGLLGLVICVSVTYIYGYINCNVVFCSLGVFVLCLLCYSFKDCIKKALRYIWQKTKDVRRIISGIIIFLMGYGYKWVNVIIVYAILILFGAVGYYCYKSDGNCSWLYTLNRSFYNIIALNCNITEHGCWGMLASFHHLLGVLLIGYLGFIFANKMRNNL